MRLIHGAVLVPQSTASLEATVVVRLLDVSIVDVPARLVAETSFAFSGGPTRRIPFELSITDAVVGRAHLALSAEIRTKDATKLQGGDWVTTRATPLSMAEIEAGNVVEVAVERIVEQ